MGPGVIVRSIVIPVCVAGNITTNTVCVIDIRSIHAVLYSTKVSLEESFIQNAEESQYLYPILL